MMIQRICIGPAPACWVPAKANCTRRPAFQATKALNSSQLPKRTLVEDCEPLSADLDQLIALQLGDGVGDRLAIHSEPLCYLLVGEAGNLVPAASPLKKHRCNSGGHRLERGLLVPLLGVYQPLSKSLGNVSRDRRRSCGELIEIP